MIKAKEISVKNIAVFLVLAFAMSAGYYLARPRVTTTRSVPVFIGEEVVINNAVAFKTATTRAAKAEVAPVPPKAAMPLPIIPPAVVFKVMPSYPAAALEKGLSGMVLLSVYVGLKGSPEKVETKASSGVPVLDDSAIKAVSQWTFNPATQGGAALPCWYEIPIRFEVK